VGFDSPEGWALKYFTSASIMSGLQPPDPMIENNRRWGSLAVGFEVGWIPTLTPGQAQVGFSGHKQEDVSKAPIFARPVIRVGLPWKFVGVVAGPPPITIFGVTPHLLALGLERPIIERTNWTIGWRASGQFGAVKAPFTCPQRALGFPGGSPQNPNGCIGTSYDAVFMRYAGTEVQASYRIPGFRRLIPHAAQGINYLIEDFQVNAPLATVQDRTHLWTRGKTFTTTGGVSYLFSKRVSLTVDMFYTPLRVERTAGIRTNDGLFNVRALVNYAFR